MDTVRQSDDTTLTLASDFTFKGDHFFWTDSKVVLGYIANEARRFICS